MKRILENIQKSFSPEEGALDAIKKMMTVKTLGKNEHFLKSGDICNCVAFIEKGSMRQYFSYSKKEVSSDFFFENSFIVSFASFLSQQPSIVNISAIETCELLVLHHADVMQLIDTYPSLRKFADVLIREQYIRAERREAALLLLSPEERFNRIVEEHPKLFKRIPLHYVASYLAITPETLSRYRRKHSQ